MSDLLNYHKKLIQLQIPDISIALHNHWLWNLDLREEVSARKMLNEAHLTGMVLCRTAALKQGIIAGDPRDTLGEKAVLITKYNDMSMCTLHDSVEHCQMHMQLLLEADVDFGEHLDRLFARLGQLLLPLNLPDSMFDVKDDLEVGINGNTTKIMSSSVIRWYMNVFVILYRHCAMHHTAEDPVPVEERLQLESFHIEASRDDFYKHAQYYDLPPAAALVYSIDFGDLLNNVSQITFYCYPEYIRRDLIEEKQVASGDHAIYTLAAALAMKPNISVVHEDDSFAAAPGACDSSAMALHRKAGWRIVLAPGTIMLLSNEGKLFKHRNVLELLRAVPS
jgi:hypothetical protein